MIFTEKEITYANTQADITLAGTLTVPQSSDQFPVAFLIGGMGPLDRDGTNYYGHKPQQVLAHYLAEKGIATLRIDKRGVGASTGTFNLSVTPNDLASDVAAGLAYLTTCPEIDHQRIGLIGHSEGGLVATMLAVIDEQIAFVALMAAAVGNSTTTEQTAVQLRADGASTSLIDHNRNAQHQLLEIIRHEPDQTVRKAKLSTAITEYWTTLPTELKHEANTMPWAITLASSEPTVSFMGSPYYHDMLTCNAPAALARIKAPLLALYGEHDFMAPHLMIPLIKKAMEAGKKTNYTLKTLPGLNHSFQTCTSGAMAEYATSTETLAPIALETLSIWILGEIEKK
ncbi:MAG: uncharacterized protein QG604_988 [Candidatus Dependentiae bacterium]|nr:uncharacterized protein [Candidatus Dependentiae bacterium]